MYARSFLTDQSNQHNYFVDEITQHIKIKLLKTGEISRGSWSTISGSNTQHCAAPQRHKNMSPTSFSPLFYLQKFDEDLDHFCTFK